MSAKVWHYMRLSVEMLLEKFATDAELIEQPLIRSGNQLAIGWDEAFGGMLSPKQRLKRHHESF
ncbi:MAG: hypothetical protein R2865_12945 [Deinococcales bacterium]